MGSEQQFHLMHCLATAADLALLNEVTGRAVDGAPTPECQVELLL
jgi:hypothetical protein